MLHAIEKFYFRPDALFEGLETAYLQEFEKFVTRKIFHKNTILFTEGEKPKGTFYLVKGKVKILQTNKGGQEQIIYIYTEGDLMGYRPILCSEPNPVSAITLEDCVIDFLSKKHFLQLLSRSKVLSNKLLVNLSHEFGVLVNNISVFARQNVRERVALGLLILHEKYKTDAKEQIVEINLSRENFANYIGTAQETLVRILHDMKAEKSIYVKGRKIIVLKPDLLLQIANL